MRSGHAISHRACSTALPLEKAQASDGRELSGNLKMGGLANASNLSLIFRLSRNCRSCGGSAAKNGLRKREVESANYGRLISPRTAYNYRRTIFSSVFKITIVNRWAIDKMCD